MGNYNVYVKLWRDKKIRLSDGIFFISLFLFLIINMLYETMFNVYINHKISLIINLFCITLIGIKIVFFDRYSLKTILLIIGLGLCAIFIWIESSYSRLIYLVIFIIGSKGIDFNKIVKMFLYTKISITLLAILACELNLIEHIIYLRDGKLRYAFGSIYATDFAAGVFFSIVAYCYLKFDKLKFRDIVIFIFLSWFLKKYCDARLDSICIIMVAIFCSYFVIRRKIKKQKTLKVNKFIKSILIFSIPISAIISIALTYFYNSSNKIMFILNGILSNRLEIGKIGIEKYGFKLFGQYVPMVGNGGANIERSDYFFIDSSYLSIVLTYGIVILIVICMLYSYFINNAIKSGNLIIAFCIGFIAINCIVAHHFMQISYNPFLLVFFAKINTDTNRVHCT